jgi:hypothetical protein
MRASIGQYYKLEDFADEAELLEARAERYDWIMAYAPHTLLDWVHDNLDCEDPK